MNLLDMLSSSVSIKLSKTSLTYRGNLLGLTILGLLGLLVFLVWIVFQLVV